jgi:hypothetical protein
MQQFALTPIRIGRFEPGGRGSIFSPASNDLFRRPAMAGPRLGQSAMEWFNRAKHVTVRYADLMKRVGLIANVSYRNDVIDAYIGDAANTSSGLYRFNSVKSDLADVEGTTPLSEGIKQYENPRRTSRIEQLEAIVHDFNDDVERGEKAYGVIPPGEVITRETIVQVPTVPGWVVPVGLGLAAIAAAALLGLFSKKG